MNVIVSNKFQTQLNSLQIDIIKSIDGEFNPEEITEMFSNFFFNKMIIDITAIKGYRNIENIQKLALGLDMSKVILVLDDSDITVSPQYLSQLISLGIYNFTRNIDNIPFLIDNPNTYKDVAQYQQISPTVGSTVSKNEPAKFKNDDITTGGFTAIIGVKNVTDHAGATTLIYMMKKQLKKNYQVLALEVDKSDFLMFSDNEMISTSSDKIKNVLKSSNTYDVILIDLNNSAIESECSDVLYLIEPSTIKLNKMIRRNRNIFDRLRSKKIILNQSLLDNKDVMDFEYESKSKVFYNVPPLDDKKDKHRVLDDMLNKIGFARQNVDASSNSDRTKLIGLFKNKA